jgi:lipopolysaccharide export system protein LptA
MYMRSCCRPMMPKNNWRNGFARPALACLGIALSANAFALKSDRDQQMLIDANRQTSIQSQTGKASDPDVTHLDGNVVMIQGSMKGRGDNAVIYKNPSGVVDAKGNAGKMTRVVFTGKPAHMQQVHDDDCGLMTADANTIDYDVQTGIATLTGQVVVVQKGKGESHSEHMIYDTNTGAMESGDTSPTSRVHMVMEPKSEPAAPSQNNCGFPVGNGAHAKTAKTAAAAAAPAKKDDQH